MAEMGRNSVGRRLKMAIYGLFTATLRAGVPTSYESGRKSNMVCFLDYGTGRFRRVAAGPVRKRMLWALGRCRHFVAVAAPDHADPLS